MTGRTKPYNLERLGVILMVGLRLRLAAFHAITSAYLPSLDCLSDGHSAFYFRSIPGFVVFIHLGIFLFAVLSVPFEQILPAVRVGPAALI